MYRAIDPDLISAKTEALCKRIGERFPDSGLLAVGRELRDLVGESNATIAKMQRPHWPARVAVFLGLVIIGGAVAGLVLAMPETTSFASLSDILQGLEAGVNDVVFLGIAVFFLFTVEGRLKRREALRALHEIRSIAHVIDLHQLTKDPEQLISPRMGTPSSPHHGLTRFELVRYLAYCSEMLSITSNAAALYLQRLDDSQVLDAVNNIQGLSTGLQAKIWQKILILDSLAFRAESPAGDAPSATAPTPPAPPAPSPAASPPPSS